MRFTAPSWAAIATALLLGVGVLSPGTTARADGPCQVIVVTTDAKGDRDPNVKPFLAPCREGESNGGTEYYNPYTDHRWYYGPGYAATQPWLSGVTASSSGNITSGTPTSSCTPAAPGGTKFQGKTVVRPGAAPTCPAGSTPAR